MIKQILDRLLIKKMGYIKIKDYYEERTKQQKAIQKLNLIIEEYETQNQKLKNQIENLKKRIKYAAEKKYL